MNVVKSKLDYTKRWVNDIYLALKEKGIQCDDYALERIGNEVRKLHVYSGENAMFGMQTGMRSQSIDVLYFEGDLEAESKCKLCAAICCDNPNDPVYNTIHDYYRVIEITGFKYQHELIPATITNEREEY